VLFPGEQFGNGLVQSWPEISRLARELPASKPLQPAIELRRLVARTGTRQPLTVIQEYGYRTPMKATIEIPDDLYRKVKAKSALQGRPVRAVAEELFRRWVEEGTVTADHASARMRLERLENAFRLADEAFKNAPPGPSAREILEQDRSRLDRR